jgi:polysaccharide export outer membrane protein
MSTFNLLIERCFYRAKAIGLRRVSNRAFRPQPRALDAHRGVPKYRLVPLKTSGLKVISAFGALLVAVSCHADFANVTPAATVSSATSEYVIGPGDHLTVFVYDNPQLCVTDLPVRPDGRVSTPLVPDVTAAGKTPAELASTLTDRLKKYVKDPNVTIMVRDFIGPFDRQIRVIGEAADPQAIAYSEHMTVLDVMIRTKGLTRFADGNDSVIVRTVPGHGTTQLRVHLSDLIKDGDISQNVEMQPGDTLIIPQTWF